VTPPENTKGETLFVVRIEPDCGLFFVEEEGKHANFGKEVTCGELCQIHLGYEGKIVSFPLRPREAGRKVRRTAKLGTT
jgi:hypothetical protein